MQRIGFHSSRCTGIIWSGSSSELHVKRNPVVLALTLSVLALSRAAAQESLEFTLDEVEAASAPVKKQKAAPPVDAKQAIQQTLGEVRWGMSKADLLKLIKSQIRAEFELRIKVERDIMRQDALYQEAQDQYRRISENFVTFEGTKTGWDVSPIGSEFTHGNREAMLVVTGKKSRDFYFFMQGKLWKWYRELGDSEDALTPIQQRFGPGKPQLERRNDSKVAYAGATWSDGSTRVTAMTRGADACLILEDLRTFEQLAVLRHHVEPVKKTTNRAAAAIDAILLSGAKAESDAR
jgi:hypothetical protein